MKYLRHIASFIMAGVLSGCGGGSSNDPAQSADAASRAYILSSGTVYSFDGTTWATTSGSPPVSQMSSNYDYIGTVNHKTFMRRYDSDSGTYSTDQFDGTTWSVITPSNAPSDRSYGRQNYIGTLNKLIYQYTYSGVDGSYIVYSFDGATWRQVSTTTAPVGNLNGSSYIGAINSKIYHYVYSGVDGSRTMYSFDGTTWVALTAGKPDNTSNDPSASSYVGILNGKAYHWLVDTTTGLPATYEFNGSTWVKLSANTPSTLNMFTPSYLGEIGKKAYHWIKESDGTRTMYTFDGSKWETVATSGTAPSISDAELGYPSQSEVMIPSSLLGSL